jgi:hypothetical protein
VRVVYTERYESVGNVGLSASALTASGSVFLVIRGLVAVSEYSRDCGLPRLWLGGPRRRGLDGLDFGLTKSSGSPRGGIDPILLAIT